MAAHRYYRLYAKNNHGGAYLALHGLELAETIGGSNVAVSPNGTGSGSSTGQGIYPPSNAFDNNASSYWVGETTANEWLVWDFGVAGARDILEFRVLQATYGGIGTTSFIKDAEFQYSDDGDTWVTRNVIVNTQTVGTMVYPAYGTMLVAPVPTVAASMGGHSLVSAPAPTIYAGVMAVANLAISAPTPELTFGMGAAVRITAPKPTLHATAHNSYGDNAAFITTPKPQLSVFGGGRAALTAPSPNLTSTATGTALAAAALTAPSPTVASEGTVSNVASISITAPSPNVKAYSGAVCSITVGGVTLQATGTGGGVGTAAITVPLMQLDARGTAQNYGSALITAPMPSISTGAQAYIIAPMATLTAIGTATVVATYEAYAMNMRHTPRRDGQEPIDEVTHYTNFPFTHIVRYKNSYFGANSTGLYLLEGTTDDGVDIDWAVKTHLTDLGYPEKKTVVSAYFGGRLGPAETVTLVVGEKGDETYSYSTPRGAAVQNYRQVFGRGVKTRYFGLGLSGSQDFTLDTIDLEVNKLTRRI